jgi:hypothetical protein
LAIIRANSQPLHRKFEALGTAKFEP